LTNLRHFALEQAAKGRRVVHLVAKDDDGGDYASVLRPFARAHGPLLAMVPAERELRHDLQPLVDEGLLELVPHTGWLSTAADFQAAGGPDGPWRMDAFYRAVRRRTGHLMDARGKPEGGQFSFDGDNRKPWKGTPPAPTPPRFVVDDVTAEVVELVTKLFPDHPGVLDAAALPATLDDAEALWAWAKASCLPHFGPYEDAMSTSSRGLFHSRISQVMNLHRLLPKDIVDDVVHADLPLSSKEGFVRQVLGWREFVKHVHDATDGFRRGRAALADGAAAGDPSFLGARNPLPAAWWPADVAGPWSGRTSGLRCLDHVVADVWAEGYSHHITRLMVLGNIATLLDISPRALSDWFWAAYVDAYDWVVEPNVLGMATFGAGDVMTTKPYVAGSAYIDKMSDLCGSCAFSPKKPVAEGGCPLTPMYWDFLRRHELRLRDIERLKLPLASMRKRSDAQKAHDQEVFQITRRVLGAGQRLTTTAFTGG
jgi:deoxyribodipyrimidine photolyase-related protein